MHQEWQHECRLLLQSSKQDSQVEQDQSPPKPALAAIAWPGSQCHQCLTTLKPWHNIPVISYCLLRGKCAFCKIKISPMYPHCGTIKGNLRPVNIMDTGAKHSHHDGPNINVLLSGANVY